MDEERVLAKSEAGSLVASDIRTSRTEVSPGTHNTSSLLASLDILLALSTCLLFWRHLFPLSALHTSLMAPGGEVQSNHGVYQDHVSLARHTSSPVYPVMAVPSKSCLGHDCQVLRLDSGAVH